MRAWKVCLPMSWLLFASAPGAIASEAFVAQPALPAAGVIQGRIADQLLSVPLANALALATHESAPPTNMPPGANSAQVFQVGANNAATVLQSGVGNIAAIYQHGQNNTATVVQFARSR
jgi:hypothetical protein